jgi:hypothetical protein
LQIIAAKAQGLSPSNQDHNVIFPIEGAGHKQVIGLALVLVSQSQSRAN